MAKLVNLARMTTATVGTGAIILGAAVSGFLTFAAAGINDGDVISYSIRDGANSEVGTGTYTAATKALTRTVRASTNANAAILLSGSAEVFVTPAAEDLQTELEMKDGTAAVPALSFLNEPTTGLYRPGAGQLGVSILGAAVGQWNAQGLSFGPTTIPGLQLNPLTTTQQNALAAPAGGWTIWNTTLSQVSYYDGAAWQQLAKLNSPTFTTPNLGTPSAGTLTNCTGLPIAGIASLGTGVATALAAAVTGSGGIALATSPTFVTPALGVATATSINKMAITAPATASTFAVSDGKSAAFNNSITIAGTDGKTATFTNALTITGNDGTITFGAASANITFQGTDTYVGRQTTDTLTNKTITGLLLTAGSTSVAPITFASGTNLTSAVAGAEEYDGVQMYFTLDTSSGRGAIPVQQYFHLTASGGTITSIANFFGATSNITLVASAYYIIDIVLYYSKNATSDTVVWTLTNSAAPTNMRVHYEMSPIAGPVTPPGTATALVGQDSTASATYTVTTGTIQSAPVFHYARFRLWLQNGTGTSLKIQATATSGNIIPLVNSYWLARRVSPSNIGTFAT